MFWYVLMVLFSLLLLLFLMSLYLMVMILLQAECILSKVFNRPVISPQVEGLSLIIPILLFLKEACHSVKYRIHVICKKDRQRVL